MARKRSTLSQMRRFLYNLARLLGDVQAVSRGPEAMAKRVARKAAGRAVSRVLWRLLK